MKEVGSPKLLFKNLDFSHGTMCMLDEAALDEELGTGMRSVDWDCNGIPDLLIGAEDGFLYYLKNPRAN